MQKRIWKNSQKILNLLKNINLNIQEVWWTLSKINKYPMKVPHNLIGENQWQRENLKESKKKAHYIQKNKSEIYYRIFVRNSESQKVMTSNVLK